MKRLLPLFLIAALAITAITFRNQWLPQPPGSGNYLGYVESDQILLSPPVAGRLAERPLNRGDTAKAGAMAFRLADAERQAAVDQARAALEVVILGRCGGQRGKRPQEIEVIRAQRQTAEASLTLAQSTLARARSLAASGTAARAQLDSATATVKQLQAQIEGYDAQLALAQMGAREQEIAAAKAQADAAAAALAQAESRLADLTLTVPRAAQVDDTYFEVGEWVGAGQPVVALQPADGLKLILFIPEAALARAAPGTRLSFTCDSCAAGLSATITHVAQRPEYSPPVIYSETARAKLVYRVEARPDQPSAQLRPGLPVEIAPLP